jgi:hypothetical protein
LVELLYGKPRRVWPPGRSLYLLVNISELRRRAAPGIVKRSKGLPQLPQSAFSSGADISILAADNASRYFP